MIEKRESAQESFLDKLKAEGKVVHVFLVSGIKLIGKVASHDQYSIELTSNDSSQVVFKRAISTIMPGDGQHRPGNVSEHRSGNVSEHRQRKTIHRGNN